MTAKSRGCLPCPQNDRPACWPPWRYTASADRMCHSSSRPHWMGFISPRPHCSRLGGHPGHLCRKEDFFHQVLSTPMGANLGSTNGHFRTGHLATSKCEVTWRMTEQAELIRKHVKHKVEELYEENPRLHPRFPAVHDIPLATRLSFRTCTLQALL